MDLRYSTKKKFKNYTQCTRNWLWKSLAFIFATFFMLPVSNGKKTKTNKPIKQTNKTHTQNKHLLNDNPVMAQSLTEVSYFNHRQTTLHKDTFMMFKLGSYYVPQVCICIFVFIQSIPFKMSDLLEYCLDPISCILEFSCTFGLP